MQLINTIQRLINTIQRLITAYRRKRAYNNKFKSVKI